jgi:cyanobactin biosynthesis protein (PatB/AcyB/McaB family)
MAVPPPLQAPPVSRPDLIQPWRTVNISEGTLQDLVSVYMHLTHGANYDDPAPWQPASYNGRTGSR